MALAGVSLFAALAASPVAAQRYQQERLDLAMVEAIREEGLERSRIPALARHLTEVIGPRLTGSPGMDAANEWTSETFREWGLENVQLEPWGEFGRGWERVSYSGRVVEPFVQLIHAQPLAWSGSTDGLQRGPILIISSLEDLEAHRGELEGAFILTSDPNEVGPEFDGGPFRRWSLDDLLIREAEEEDDGGAGPTQAQIEAFRAARQRAIQLRDELRTAAREEGAVALLQPSRRGYGNLSSVNGDPAGRVPGAPEPVAQLVVAPEHYNAIWRNVSEGIPVTLEMAIENRFIESDPTAYNSLADIPGSDLADEIVMIGAHLDSWHMGTGATDNASGSVVMMEAMRILKTLGVQPRRTIRIALWSGEEQGLFGSRLYVENHPELHDRISVYLNMDNGTGRIRGIRTQGNEAAVGILEQILWPFRDLGVVTANADNSGGTDHLSFTRAGIPGFNVLQDPIEYSLRTHHTWLDTYDHLVIEDLQQAAVVVASTVYHLAMRDGMIPRPGTGPATDR